MALIPLDPEPRPHRWRFVAIYLVLVFTTVLGTGLYAWWCS